MSVVPVASDLLDAHATQDAAVMPGKLHVVLFEPEIPQNAGNIARTCACTGATLHLVEPLGFRLSQKNLKRAGMDYLDDVEMLRHSCAREFLSLHGSEQLLLFTGSAERSLYDCEIDCKRDVYLVFGRESRGIDPWILQDNAERCVRLPMCVGARSLNLSNAVAVGVYETLRRNGFAGLQAGNRSCYTG